jgi:hypothetical protein
MPVPSTQRDQRELREAVGTACLLAREELERVEARARRLAVRNPDLARAPAFEERTGADAQGRDSADAGDDHVAHQDLATM